MRALLILAALAAGKERPPIVDPVLYDAVILGGGPAAVAAAARLAERGRTVMLLERTARLGLEGGLCAAPPEELPERLMEPVVVRLRAHAAKVSPGEHLVSVRYRYQGLPRLVRARYAVLSWPGEALVEGPAGRVLYATALPGRAGRRGRCAAAEVLRRLQSGGTPEDWPPCGLP